MGGQTAARVSKCRTSCRCEECSQASAPEPASSHPHADIFDLQHAAGNRAVSDLLQSSRAGSAGSNVPPDVRSVLNSGGQPLDPAVRATMERRFGHDFCDVRVHTDARAVESARAVNARAYTVGRDVVFAGGQYAPDTTAGRALLAHELAHTLQQRGGGAPPSADPHGPHETSARASAQRVAVGQEAHTAQPAAGVGLSMSPDDEEKVPEEEEKKKPARQIGEIPTTSSLISSGRHKQHRSGWFAG